jgi:transposase
LFLKSACPCSFCSFCSFIRYNDTVKRYYQRKLAKTKVVVARKTVAHKLARACFYMLRNHVEFDVNKAFGGIK